MGEFYRVPATFPRSMKNKMRAVFFLLACGLALAAPAALAEMWRNHFDADAISRSPAFFDFQVLGAPGTARWMVLNDVNPPSAPNQLTQVVANRPDGSIGAALRRTVAMADGKLSVALKKVPAREGLVFRMTDEKNFLVLLLDGKSGETRLIAYRNGMPTELARGEAAIDREWGVLVVSLAGPAISASWNEKELLRVTDAHPASGRVGLATAGPGRASFDEFVIDTGDEARKP
jgi:hypothetical protein